MEKIKHIDVGISKKSIILNALETRNIDFCGIYFLLEKNSIIYVGQTKNGFFRIFEHIKTKSFEKFSLFACEKGLLDYYENYFIMKLRPKLNKVIPKYGYFVSLKFLNKLLFARGIRINLKKLEDLICELKLEKFYFAKELFIKRKEIKTLVEVLLRD